MKRQVGSRVTAAIFAALVHCGAAQNAAPIITCTATRQMSIDLTVCAGAGGAPGGFAVEWALLPDASDAKAFDWKTGAVCKAEFSFGNRGCHCNETPRRDYILDVLEDRTNVTVRIGALFDDEIGVELHGDAGSELACGRRYVFRAYALATTNGIERSAYTTNLAVATSRCVGQMLPPARWRRLPLPELPPCACSGSGDAARGLCLLSGDCYNEPGLRALLNTRFHGSGPANKMGRLAHQVAAVELSLLQSRGRVPAKGDSDIGEMLAAAHIALRAGDANAADILARFLSTYIDP